MSLRIKEALESMIDDLSTTESVMINEDSQKVIAYSKVAVDGDQLAITDQTSTPELIELHAAITESALQGKMSLVNMAGIVLDTLKPI